MAAIATVSLTVSLLAVSAAIAPSARAATSQPVQMASLFNFSGTRPDNLGVKDGKLAACPKSPNCVSSQSPDTTHRIEPLKADDNPKLTLSRLKSLVENTENAEVITAEPNYLYAEYTSNLMGFVDDVEFYADESDGVVHARSASRLGESDLGVNRKRVESIRQQLNG